MKSDKAKTVSSFKATGVFGWPAGERRSDRYGMIMISEAPYDGPAQDNLYSFQPNDLIPLVGKKVSISARVIVTRESKHIGDMFRGIFPATPKLGQTFNLGTGKLFCDDSDDMFRFGIEPDDGRANDWFDPKKLYKLHDQTVELTVKIAK